MKSHSPIQAPSGGKTLRQEIEEIIIWYEKHNNLKESRRKFMIDKLEALIYTECEKRELETYALCLEDIKATGIKKIEQDVKQTYKNIKTNYPSLIRLGITEDRVRKALK